AIGSFGIYRPLSITKVTPPVMGQRILPADTVVAVVIAASLVQTYAAPGVRGSCFALALLVDLNAVAHARLLIRGDPGTARA
ncbi:hypothetical protein ISX56_33470, partial [Serratia ureilytica]|nr:hypothetical protein [Serratia ureilytica]